MMRVFLVLLLVFGALQAHAVEKTTIIATVNDKAITNKDLINRLKITMISSGLEGGPETIARIKPQVVEELVNEKIYVAEAQRLNYFVNQDQLDEAVATLEKQNNLPEGELLTMLSKNDIPHSALHEKITGEISYAYLISARVRPRARVDDEEVKEFLEAQALAGDREEFFVNEIVLPFDLPEDEEKQLELARQLKERLNNGEEFAAIAAEFSGSPSGRNGGKVGWLTENDIPKEIFTAVEKNELGKPLGPIKSVEGYYLVLISDKRTISANAKNDVVNLKQFFVQPENEQELKEQVARLEKLDNYRAACLAGDDYAADNNVQFADVGRVKIGEITPGLREIAATIEVAEFSGVVSSAQAISNFIICERVEDFNPEPSEAELEKARKFLEGKKTAMQARKFERKLRARTNVDIRL